MKFHEFLSTRIATPDFFLIFQWFRGNFDEIFHSIRFDLSLIFAGSWCSTLHIDRLSAIERCFAFTMKNSKNFTFKEMHKLPQWPSGIFWTLFSNAQQSSNFWTKVSKILYAYQHFPGSQTSISSRRSYMKPSLWVKIIIIFSSIQLPRSLWYIRQSSFYLHVL